MSWLNFNDSLSSLKGQLTNLAQSVLTEETDEGNFIPKSFLLSDLYFYLFRPRTKFRR